MKTININTLEGGTLGLPVIDVTDDPTYKVDSLGKDLAGNNLALPIIINGSGGGGGGDETDPIYTADKPNIALKSELVEVESIENTLEGSNLTSTITNSDGSVISSTPVTLPSSGGASNYFEADLSGTTFPLELTTSLVSLGDTSTPFTGNGNSDYSLNIQGTFSRTGGSAADDVVTLQVVTNGGYMTLIDVNFNVQRNTSKFPFSYHTKKYNFGGAPTYLKVSYTGSGTVSIDSLSFWVE